MKKFIYIIDNYKMSTSNLTGIEDRNRYDWIAYYEDEEWNRYSRNYHPIEKDEMCKWGNIYKVEEVRDGDGRFDYHWKILSVRKDLPVNEGEDEEIS